MGTISSIEPQQRSRDRVNVYVDGEFAIGIFATTAVEAGLHVGAEISDTDLQEIEERESAAAARERVYRLLSHRPRSIAEVRLRLRQADVEANIIDLVLADLEERGYLDDVAFSRFWIENRQSNRPRGAMLLRAELRQKGVAPDIIDEILDETDLDELENARAFAASRVGAMGDLDETTFRRRLGGQLSRKGYSWDIVRQILDEVRSDSDQSGGSPVV